MTLKEQISPLAVAHILASRRIHCWGRFQFLSYLSGAVNLPKSLCGLYLNLMGNILLILKILAQASTITLSRDLQELYRILAGSNHHLVTLCNA
jgi:hypothetical protein